MPNKYLLLFPDIGSKTAWQRELRTSIPSELPDDIKEKHVINLKALKVEAESKDAGPEVNEFTVSDSVEIWEINRNTLHEWLKRDLIEPSIEKKSGKGKKYF